MRGYKWCEAGCGKCVYHNRNKSDPKPYVCERCGTKFTKQEAEDT